MAGNARGARPTPLAALANPQRLAIFPQLSEETLLRRITAAKIYAARGAPNPARPMSDQQKAKLRAAMLRSYIG
jgi:hypothetical protein